MRHFVFQIIYRIAVLSVNTLVFLHEEGSAEVYAVTVSIDYIAS